MDDLKKDKTAKEKKPTCKTLPTTSEMLDDLKAYNAFKVVTGETTLYDLLKKPGIIEGKDEREHWRILSLVTTYVSTLILDSVRVDSRARYRYFEDLDTLCKETKVKSLMYDDKNLEEFKKKLEDIVKKYEDIVPVRAYYQHRALQPLMLTRSGSLEVTTDEDTGELIARQGETDISYSLPDVEVEAIQNELNNIVKYHPNTSRIFIMLLSEFTKGLRSYEKDEASVQKSAYVFLETNKVKELLGFSKRSYVSKLIEETGNSLYECSINISNQDIVKEEQKANGKTKLKKEKQGGYTKFRLIDKMRKVPKGYMFRLSEDFTNFLAYGSSINYIPPSCYKLSDTEFEMARKLFQTIHQSEVETKGHKKKYPNLTDGDGWKLIKVKTLLNDCPSIPDIETVNKKYSRHVTDRIIDPVIKSLDTLHNEKIIGTWEFCGKRGAPLTDDELKTAYTSYEQFSNLNIRFKSLDLFKY